MSELNDVCALCVMSQQYEHNLVKKVNKLEEVSGHSIDTLISLFAKGYELTEPPKSTSFSD